MMNLMQAIARHATNGVKRNAAMTAVNIAKDGPNGL
jgi:hypothetical protein